MKQTLMACGLLMACGAEPGPLPAPADGGDAAVDAGRDVPPGFRPECAARRMLDCNNDGVCDTPTGELNCGACGRVCPAGQACDITGTLCF